MSSKTAKTPIRSAAWRISLWRQDYMNLAAATFAPLMLLCIVAFVHG